MQTTPLPRSALPSVPPPAPASIAHRRRVRDPAAPLPDGPRERAVRAGVDALGDAELVALVLGSGTRDEPVLALAGALLDEAGGTAGLGRAGLGSFVTRRGLGPAKGARLAASIELGRRVAQASFATRPRLPDSRAVESWARPRLVALDHEELWLLALDGNNGLVAARRVAMGGLHGLHVDVRDPLRTALREGASLFVLVHNHPSGDPTPSPEDLAFTTLVLRASHAVGVLLADHVVVARNGYVSMLESGLLEALVHREPPGSAPPRASPKDP